MIKKIEKNQARKIFGTINIGASAFRMIIAEISNGQIKELDTLIKPLRLGVDTFTQGFISLEHVKRASDILSSFKVKLDEYGACDYKAICTSGVREASNKDFFIDYVKTHANINLHILEPSEEVYIKYLSAKANVANFSQMEKEGVIFANIASGNVTLSITRQDTILYSGALPYGSLRLRQMFLNIPANKRYRAFNQYAENMVNSVANAISNYTDKPVQNIVCSGSSINMLVRIFNPKNDFITKNELLALYKKIHMLTKQELIEELHLRDDEAEVILPTLCIYLQLLKFANANKFHFSKLSFPSMLTRFYHNMLPDQALNKRLKNTLLSIGERFSIDTKHALRVQNHAKKLFNSLKDIHSIPESSDNILEMASILYQVGKYIDPNNITENSYFIIKSITIPGTPYSDISLAANVVFNLVNLKSEKEFMSIEKRLLTNKLSAILRIACCLDASMSGIIEATNVKIMKNMIIIEAETNYKEPFIEIISFDKQKNIFEETFGIPIDMRVKVKYE